MVLCTRGVHTDGDETMIPPSGRVDSSEEVLTRIWTVSIGGMIPSSAIMCPVNQRNIVQEAYDNGEGDSVPLAEQALLNKLLRRDLVVNRNRVEVLQRDPNSPLFSVKTHQNLIAQSQSGTGKTAAFSLAILSHVKPENKWTQCLCVSPTYELALQIGQVIEQMGKFCPDVKLAYGIRGNRMVRGVKLQEQIVIGTPGTVLDWCTKYKHIDPKKITMFVFDEADLMIATQGHRDQSIRIHRQLTKDCQMLLFSATFEESVLTFAQHVVSDPNIIKLKREEETLDNIKQFYVICRAQEDKFTSLCNLYGVLTIAQAMIFCHTRRMASWLSSKLISEGHQVALLSGELEVKQRAAIIERFRHGKEKVLVTTNVCSRGIDVEQVSLVVNFDLPVDREGNADNETYLHRIGRTGRFGRRGFAVNMVDSDHSMDIIKQIELHFKYTILGKKWSLKKEYHHKARPAKLKTYLGSLGLSSTEL
ncbi:ATP-dependent RNA helicase DDX19B [Liparis tanakae]|uniref:RNA helicase n=1 Tax=Liparis tanakae TaxID=230148 RepID=A0A4Z2J2K6_9TELE|nr:ATP-dependent RNA helicase DDX19B [Liparis tanakae]